MQNQSVVLGSGHCGDRTDGKRTVLVDFVLWSGAERKMRAIDFSKHNLSAGIFLNQICSQKTIDECLLTCSSDFVADNGAIKR